MIWFGNVESHLDCNEDKCKLGGDQGAGDEGREVRRKPLALRKKRKKLMKVEVIWKSEAKTTAL